MPFELPADPGTARRARMAQRVTFAFAAVLVVLVAYFGYIGYEGSRQLTEAPNPSADCRTPDAMAWAYESVNLEAAGDESAEAAEGVGCADGAGAAGDEITGPGGVGLAGWYIPAASGGDSSGATVVLVHGWGSNKSQMLERAALLHDRYHLLLFDLRNHGDSDPAATTQGVREAGDLRAMLDWLATAKAPQRLAVLGVSMGGATTLSAVVGDDRVDAVIVESTHATLANAIQARLDRAGYPLSMPGSWAVLLGGLLRTGEDASSVDPVQAISRLDGRPVLLIDAALDDTIGPDDASLLRDAARGAGSPVELEICPHAGHAGAPEACPGQYGDWVLGFLERALGATD